MHHISSIGEQFLQETLCVLKEYRDDALASLDSLQKKLQNSPSGNLRVQPHKKSFQYYIITALGDTKGTYLPRKDIRKARAIAQRDYNAAAAAILKKDITTLDNFLTAFHPEELGNAFTGLHPGRRVLVAPARNPKSSSQTPSTAQTFPTATNTPRASRAGAHSTRTSPASTFAPARKSSGSTSA